jgi:hypothetical protein
MAAGAAIGAAVGGAAGKGTAAAINPKLEDDYWRGAFLREPYYLSGRTFEDYGPAYRLGYEGYSRYGGSYDRFENRLADDWNAIKGQSRLTWNEARSATRAAWHRVERALPGDFDGDGR